MKRRDLMLGTLASPLASIAPLGARAQAAWPSKPVRFIVPFAPGGGTDSVSRLICDQLSRTFNQSFVIDNKGGAGGNIGTSELAHSAPDGYTLGLISVASHTLNPMLYNKLPYDPDKDLIAISRVALLANLLGVTKSLPVNNVAELISLCKKEPGKYSFASSGPGTSLHLSGELFKAMAGVDIIHVPYKGAGAVYSDLIAGTVHMMFANMPSMIGQVRGGKVKGLGVTSAERSKAAPERMWLPGDDALSMTTTETSRPAALAADFARIAAASPAGPAPTMRMSVSLIGPPPARRGPGPGPPSRGRPRHRSLRS